MPVPVAAPHIPMNPQQHPRHQGVVLGAMQRDGGMLPDLLEQGDRVCFSRRTAEMLDQLQSIAAMAAVADKVTQLTAGIGRQTPAAEVTDGFLLGGVIEQLCTTDETAVSMGWLWRCGRRSL
jgi:hypothetical protein